ncbi:hypothetical protein [Winogradskyella sp. MH6]|uniref:hypothetical protein n=1 Tax=Winogradskyella sp. MH6 TaxID=2929510 RepID=UPI001FB2F94A|nr:hypothetical protein [Winogradskyella sp. MH6]
MYLLLMPMILVIDTNNEQYYIQLKGLARADVIKDDKEIFIIRLKLFFLKFYIHPLKAKKEKKSETSKAIKVDKKTKKLSFRTVIRIIKSFKVTQFYMNIDTGDCIANSKLYPVFSFLNYQFGGFHVNYKGQNTLVLAVENRPIRIIKSFFNI